PQVQGGKLTQYRLHGQHRHRQQDQISAPHRIGNVRGHAIHHTQGYRQLLGLRIGIAADHLSAATGLAQPLGKGAAAEAEPDDRQTAYCWLGRGRADERLAHWASTPASASRNRWFSSRSPMETRR